MSYEQFFVGGIAVGLGAVFLAAGATNQEAFFRVRKIKWIESLGGRGLARATYALIGIALIGLGIAIAMGFAPNASAAAR